MTINEIAEMAGVSRATVSRYLNGAHYTSHVSDGETVEKGQLLLEFDIPAITAAGYDITTPVIVTNSDDYQQVELLASGSVSPGTELLKVW